MILEVGKSYLTLGNKKVKIIKQEMNWTYTYDGDNWIKYIIDGREVFFSPGKLFDMTSENNLIAPLDEDGHIKTAKEKVNHPDHYNKHPSGVECITITEHMGFNLGNAIKYIWRADLKNDAMEDLKKAAWYIDREIKRREKQND